MPLDNGTVYVPDCEACLCCCAPAGNPLRPIFFAAVAAGQLRFIRATLHELRDLDGAEYKQLRGIDPQYVEENDEFENVAGALIELCPTSVDRLQAISSKIRVIAAAKLYHWTVLSGDAATGTTSMGSLCSMLGVACTLHVIVGP
jgi:hypothetical protein